MANAGFSGMYLEHIKRSKLLYAGLYLDVDENESAILQQAEVHPVLKYVEVMGWAYYGGLDLYLANIGKSLWVRQRFLHRVMSKMFPSERDEIADRIDFHLFVLRMKERCLRREEMALVFLERFYAEAYATKFCANVKTFRGISLPSVLSLEGGYKNRIVRVKALSLIFNWLFNDDPLKKSTHCLKMIPKFVLCIHPEDLSLLLREAQCCGLVARFCARGAFVWLFQYLLLLPGNFSFRAFVCAYPQGTMTFREVYAVRVLACPNSGFFGRNNVVRRMIESLVMTPGFETLLRWKNGNGKNVMHYIVQHNETYDVPALEALFSDYGVRCAMRIADDTKYTPLTFCVSRGRYEMPGIIVSVDPLLALERDGRGMNAIHCAVNYSVPQKLRDTQTSIVQNLPLLSMLKQLGRSSVVCSTKILTDPVRNDGYMSGPLMCAIIRNRMLSVRALIEFDRESVLAIRTTGGGGILHYVFLACESMFTLVNVIEIMKSFCSEILPCVECVRGAVHRCYRLQLMELEDMYGRNAIHILQLVSSTKDCRDVMDYIVGLRNLLKKRKYGDALGQDEQLQRLMHPSRRDLEAADTEILRVMQSSPELKLW